jgi:hypothetical protein
MPSFFRFARCGKPSVSQMVWAVAFFLLLAIVQVVLRRVELPAGARYLLPIAPLGAGFFYMRSMVTDTRRQLDELQLRIYLEAAVVIVCGLFVVMLSYPLMQAAGWVGPLDHSFVMLVLFGLGAIGYITARRRYR